MAGVGKTALVRRVAAAAVSEEWFSGGAFFLDFRGYDAIPIEPGDVLRPLLNALGIPIDQIPLDVASQSAVFHRVLSERARTGMNVLLILDNVSASDQIAGLIPGPPNRALVTSRHLLADIEGVRILNLEVLDDHQAVGLMREALRRQNSADTRIESEPEQAHQLAQLCGGLPLALRIAAALLAEDSSFTIASLVERLSNVSDRLKELKYGDNWAVRRAFDSSYGHLGAEQSHMFRLLALNPGPHISVGAAAVQANVPEHVARQLLAGLHRAHLVELGPNFGTYRLHDLLSIYAAEECQASETVDRRTEALGRLFEYYLVASRSAISHLDPVTTAPPSGTFVDRSSALVWLEAERPNLTASIALAADVGEMPHARDLSLCLSPFFDLRKHWADWTSTHQLALAATRHLGDRAGEASVLNSIGRAYRELRRFDEAVTHLELALAIFGELGDPHGQGVAFNNMGNTYGELGQFDVAIQYYRRAGELFSQLGDRHMEGRIFNNMGNDYAKLGRHQDALDYHLRALTIFKDTENSYGEAHEGYAKVSLKK